MNEYRHVCLKDLNKYFKIEDYLGGLSLQEAELVKANLGIVSVIRGTYDEIKQFVDQSKLNISCKYIITDFQTIYLSNSGDIWGLDVNPSSVYQIVLSPITESLLNPNVYIIDENHKVYEGQYDINSEILRSEKSSKEATTKGKITYLKDSNGNSAYYDFKNIKFRISLSPEIDPRLQEVVTLDVYTFNTPTDSPELYTESSMQIYNNQLGINCTNNIFLNKCYNNKLLSGSNNNLFVDQVSNINDTLSNAVIYGLFVEDTLSVQFNTINDCVVATKTKLLQNKIMIDVITLVPNTYVYV